MRAERPVCAAAFHNLRARAPPPTPAQVQRRVARPVNGQMTKATTRASSSLSLLAPAPARRPAATAAAGRRAGADASSRDRDEALQFAAWKGQLWLVEKLLGEGANPRAVIARYRCSALMKAAALGSQMW